jgi:hypothetical protein
MFSDAGKAVRYTVPEILDAKQMGDRITVGSSLEDSPEAKALVAKVLKESPDLKNYTGADQGAKHDGMGVVHAVVGKANDKGYEALTADEKALLTAVGGLPAAQASRRGTVAEEGMTSGIKGTAHAIGNTAKWAWNLGHEDEADVRDALAKRDEAVRAARSAEKVEPTAESGVFGTIGAGTDEDLRRGGALMGAFADPVLPGVAKGAKVLGATKAAQAAKAALAENVAAPAGRTLEGMGGSMATAGDKLGTTSGASATRAIGNVASDNISPRRAAMSWAVTNSVGKVGEGVAGVGKFLQDTSSSALARQYGSGILHDAAMGGLFAVSAETEGEDGLSAGMLPVGMRAMRGAAGALKPISEALRPGGSKSGGSAPVMSDAYAAAEAAGISLDQVQAARTKMTADQIKKSIAGAATLDAVLGDSLNTPDGKPARTSVIPLDAATFAEVVQKNGGADAPTNRGGVFFPELFVEGANGVAYRPVFVNVEAPGVHGNIFHELAHPMVDSFVESVAKSKDGAKMLQELRRGFSDPATQEALAKRSPELAGNPEALFKEYAAVQLGDLLEKSGGVMNRKGFFQGAADVVDNIRGLLAPATDIAGGASDVQGTRIQENIRGQNAARKVLEGYKTPNEPVLPGQSGLGTEASALPKSSKDIRTLATEYSKSGDASGWQNPIDGVKAIVAERALNDAQVRADLESNPAALKTYFEAAYEKSVPKATSNKVDVGAAWDRAKADLYDAVGVENPDVTKARLPELNRRLKNFTAELSQFADGRRDMPTIPEGLRDDPTAQARQQKAIDRRYDLEAGRAVDAIKTAKAEGADVLPDIDMSVSMNEKVRQAVADFEKGVKTRTEKAAKTQREAETKFAAYNDAVERKGRGIDHEAAAGLKAAQEKFLAYQDAVERKGRAVDAREQAQRDAEAATMAAELKAAQEKFAAYNDAVERKGRGIEAEETEAFNKSVAAKTKEQEAAYKKGTAEYTAAQNKARSEYIDLLRTPQATEGPLAPPTGILAGDAKAQNAYTRAVAALEQLARDQAEAGGKTGYAAGQLNRISASLKSLFEARVGFVPEQMLRDVRTALQSNMKLPPDDVASANQALHQGLAKGMKAKFIRDLADPAVPLELPELKGSREELAALANSPEGRIALGLDSAANRAAGILMAKSMGKQKNSPVADIPGVDAELTAEAARSDRKVASDNAKSAADFGAAEYGAVQPKALYEVDIEGVKNLVLDEGPSERNPDNHVVRSLTSLQDNANRVMGLKERLPRDGAEGDLMESIEAGSIKEGRNFDETNRELDRVWRPKLYDAMHKLGIPGFDKPLAPAERKTGDTVRTVLTPAGAKRFYDIVATQAAGGHTMSGVDIASMKAGKPKVNEAAKLLDPWESAIVTSLFGDERSRRNLSDEPSEKTTAVGNLNALLSAEAHPELAAELGKGGLGSATLTPIRLAKLFGMDNTTHEVAAWDAVQKKPVGSSLFLNTRINTDTPSNPSVFGAFSGNRIEAAKRPAARIFQPSNDNESRSTARSIVAAERSGR